MATNAKFKSDIGRRATVPTTQTPFPGRQNTIRRSLRPPKILRQKVKSNFFRGASRPRAT